MADTAPITPGRFAAALRDLSLSVLHLKVLEIRNSIAHLDYSNEQLRPFAAGTDPSFSTADDPPQPDQDCVDAIRENEVVIARMQERIGLVKQEVERRGCSWTEFMSKEEIEEEQRRRAVERGVVNGDGVNGDSGEAVNGEGRTHSAWTDGTFQVGTISNGEVRTNSRPGQQGASGGSLTDEELRRRLEEQLGSLEDEDDEEGMHL